MSLRRLLPVLASVALCACASSPVYTDFDPSADFSSFETFAFLEPRSLVAAPEGLNPLVPPRIEEATRRELLAKGFTEAQDPSQADLIVSFTLGARDRVQVTDYPAYYGPGPYGRPYAWGGAYYDDVDVRSYTEGVLSIDMVAVESKAPVWHGKTVRTITDAMRRDPQSAINEAVAEILEPFPPGRGDRD